MTANITVFYNLSPNIRDNNYIVSDVLSDWQTGSTDTWGVKYLAWLKAQNAGATYRYKDYNGITYQIYNGLYIDLPYNENLEASPAYSMITYLAIASANKKYMFYHVNKVQLLGDRIRVFVTLDNWGTYIGYARFKNVTITKTNKQADSHIIPLYITEGHNSRTANKLTYQAPYLTQNRLARFNIVFYAAIQYKSIKKTTVDVDQLEVFAFFPNEVLGKTDPTNITSDDIFSAADMISSIFQGGKTIQDLEAASIVRLYAFDNSLYSLPEENTEDGYIFTMVKGGATVNIPGWRVKSTKGFKREINLINGPLGFSVPGIATENINIYSLGYPVYVGCKNNLMRIPNFVGVIGVTFEVQCLRDKLLFKVACNGEEKDISEGFEVPAISNTATLVSNEKTAKWLGKISQFAGGAFQLTGGPAGIVSGTLSIANTLSQPLTEGNGQPIAGGNGLFNLNQILQTNAGDVFYIGLEGVDTQYQLAEQEKINSYGASCIINLMNTDVDNNLFGYMNNRPYLLTDATNLYLQCSAVLNGIPDTSATEILQKLNEGVTIEYITESN